MGLEIELSSLDGNNGFTLNGAAFDDRAGSSVSGVGDINGDGIDDVLISAPNAGDGQGYVVFGSQSPFSPTIELSSLDGTNGFAINGIPQFSYQGETVSSAGDVNGDGIEDILISARSASPNGIYSGQTYVVFGSLAPFNATIEISSLDGSNGFAINGVMIGDNSGWSVSGAGDINGDGVADVLIGAPLADPNGLRSGQSYLVFGSTSSFNATFELSSLDGNNGFALNGEKALDYSGVSVSGAGDINGDGFDDILIGAYKAGPIGAGQTYVVFGSNTTFPAAFELSSLDGSNGFAINGVANTDESGFSVSGAGDINGDGVADILIGARFADPNDFQSGQSYVVFGSIIPFNMTFDLSDLDGSNGFALNGLGASEFSGWSVSGAGDINNDGLADVLIGAPSASPNGFQSGQSYVVFGSLDPYSATFELSSLDGSNGFIINGVVGQSGRSVSGAGDINGDGLADMLIGAPFAASPNGAQAGQIYVLFGPQSPVFINNQLTIQNGQTVILSSADLSATDVDTPNAELVFTVSNISQGLFQFSSNQGVPLVTFPQANVTGGVVEFVHDGSKIAPSYFVSVSDGINSVGPNAANVIFSSSGVRATTWLSQVSVFAEQSCQWLQSQWESLPFAATTSSATVENASPTEQALCDLLDKVQVQSSDQHDATIDKWHKFHLEDLAEAISERLSDGKAITEVTVYQFERHLKRLDREHMQWRALPLADGLPAGSQKAPGALGFFGAAAAPALPLLALPTSSSVPMLGH